MRITLVTSVTGGGNVFTTSDSGNPGIVQWPSGMQPGDFVLSAWYFQGNSGTATNPTQLTQIDSQVNGSTGARLLGRVIDGTETAGSNVTYTHSVQNKQNVWMGIFRGTHKSAPVQAGDFVNFNDTTSRTAHPPAAVTLAVADMPVLAFCGERGSPPSTSYTPSTGYTELYDSGTIFASGNGNTIMEVEGDGFATDRKAGTVVTPGVITGSVVAANAVLWTVALRPREYEGWGVDL